MEGSTETQGEVTKKKRKHNQIMERAGYHAGKKIEGGKRENPIKRER